MEELALFLRCCRVSPKRLCGRNHWWRATVIDQNGRTVRDTEEDRTSSRLLKKILGKAA
jgi:hypothetical protein